jgi:hypothetical protein
MDDENMCHSITKSRNAPHQCMVREQLEGFPVVSSTSRERICDTVWSAIVHSGLGVISPNSVLMSFPKLEEREPDGGHWSENTYLKTIACIKI